MVLQRESAPDSERSEETIAKDGHRHVRPVHEGDERAIRRQFLADAAVLLSSSLDYGTTLDYLMNLVVPDNADWCVIDIVSEGGSLSTVAAAHADSAKVAFAEQLQERIPATPEGQLGGA